MMMNLLKDIDLLEMTTIENTASPFNYSKYGIDLLEMTTIENFREVEIDTLFGIDLLEMTTTENGCIVILF